MGSALKLVRISAAAGIAPKCMNSPKESGLNTARRVNDPDAMGLSCEQRCYLAFCDQPGSSFLKRRTGFTLLEVMISLAILAACLIVLLQLKLRSVDSFAESKAITTSLILARSKMAEIRAAGFPELGIEEGDFGEKYPGYQWLREVTESGLDVIRKVRLVVTPTGIQNSPGAVQLETFIAQVDTISSSELEISSTQGTGGQESSGQSEGKGGESSASSSTESQSSSGGVEPFPFPLSAPPKKPSSPEGGSSAQNPVPFLPWLAPQAPRSPAPASPSPTTSLPWLPGGQFQPEEVKQ